VFHVSIWGAWSFAWGAKPTKAPRGDGTEYRLRSGTENNLTHIFLVLATAGLGHRVYRKLYTSIGGQRAEKFESHWSILSGALSVHSLLTRMKARCQVSCNVGVVFKNQQLQDFSTGGFGPAWGSRSEAFAK